MTPRQRELARHALGLPNEERVAYRDRYAALRGSETHADWEEMEEAGLALETPGLYVWFSLTRAGAEAVLAPGESLDSEDFPEVQP